MGLHFGPASIITNLAFRLLEGGIQTFRYRFGIAIDPTDLVSISVYWDGEEFEGKTRNVGALGGAIRPIGSSAAAAISRLARPL